MKRKRIIKNLIRSPTILKRFVNSVGSLKGKSSELDRRKNNFGGLGMLAKQRRKVSSSRRLQNRLEHRPTFVWKSGYEKWARRKKNFLLRLVGWPEWAYKIDTDRERESEWENAWEARTPIDMEHTRIECRIANFEKRKMIAFLLPRSSFFAFPPIFASSLSFFACVEERDEDALVRSFPPARNEIRGSSLFSSATK